MRPIRFKPYQRTELLRLGLAVEAIEMIEIEALPVSRAVLKRPPSKTDVLGELNKVSDSIAAAQRAIEGLLNATDSAPHRVAARGMISGGGRRNVLGGLTLAKTSLALDAASTVLTDALALLPDGPNRHQSANPRPIDLIHQAIQFGSIMASGEPLSPRLKPSASPTSAFHQVIGICYEAIDAPSNDPERALKAYMKQWHALRKSLEQHGFGTEPA